MLTKRIWIKINLEVISTHKSHKILLKRKEEEENLMRRMLANGNNQVMKHHFKYNLQNTLN